MATPEDTRRPEEMSEESKGVKRPAPDSTSEDPEVKVQSANEWEKVELGGDNDRKSKFLRLMGASKKEHHGRFVIGEKEKEHGVKADTSGHLVENIEAQFQQSIDHKLQGGYRGHLGLGFSKEDKSEKKEESEKKDESESKEQTKETSEAEHKDVESPREPEKETKEQSVPDSSSAATPTTPLSRADKYKKMSFVKSSS